MKGVRERETNSSEVKKCPRKGTTEVLEEQMGGEGTELLEHSSDMVK